MSTFPFAHCNSQKAESVKNDFDCNCEDGRDGDDVDEGGNVQLVTQFIYYLLQWKITACRYLTKMTITIT